MNPKPAIAQRRTLIRDSWPFVRYVRDSGRYQVDTRTTGGGGSRKWYATQEQALEAARIASEQKKEFGAASYRNDELTKYGWTVSQAVQFALEHLRATAASRLVTEAVDDLLKSKTQAKLSSLYLGPLRYELTRFAKAFEGKTLADIPSPDITDYLSDAKTPGAHNTRRKHLVTLFSFGVKNKWLKQNPAQEVNRVREKFDIKTLTPPQMARLLAACEVLSEPAAGIMRAYMALAGFAGIRPEELHRLDWADVNIAESSAFIRADVSKVGEARQVPLSPNCAAWLETASLRSGVIAPKAGFRYRFDLVRATAGYSVQGNEGNEWPSDVLRHSFASYWLAIHKNRAELAEHMGNSAKIIGKHYRRVLPQAEAQAWFGIFPSVDAEAKILRIR